MGLHGGVWAVTVPAGVLARNGHWQPCGKLANGLAYPSMHPSATHLPGHPSVRSLTLPSGHLLIHSVIYLPNYPSTHRSLIYLPIHLLSCPSFHISFHPFIRLPTNIPTYPSMYFSSIHLVTYPFILLSLYSSIHLSVQPGIHS